MKMTTGAVVRTTASMQLETSSHVAEISVQFVPRTTHQVWTRVERGTYANAHETMKIGDRIINSVRQKSGTVCVLVLTVTMARKV